MTKMLNRNDRVRILEKTSRYYGKSATVINDDSSDFLPVYVEIDGGHNSYYERKDVELIEKKRKAPKGPQAYKGNGKHEWETVTGRTWRLRVPSGWLYTESDDGVTWSAAATFVPMPVAVGYKV